MYVQRLFISNLRSFREAEVAFCYPGCEDGSPELPNVTLLLGDNGAGKTSVLRAVALATLAPVIEGSGFVPYNLVRSSGKRVSLAKAAEVRAEVLLHGQDTGSRDRSATEEAQVRTLVERRGDVERVRSPEPPEGVWEEMFTDRSPAFLVLGYGASRRVESSASFDSGARAKSRLLRYQRVSGLFEEGVTLTPLGAWLPEFRKENSGRHKQVVNLINRLLPDGTRMLDEAESDDYVFEHQGTRVPFAAMSDGYRAYIGWIADLLYHVCMGAPSNAKLVDNRGIVLVDEIDLHLHPEWQRVVVPQLARALPNLQFILTSHSPIVAGTLHAANLRVIEPDETGASGIRRLEERVHGLNADQILLSSYFGLTSTRAPEAVNELRELSRRARTGDQDAVKSFLLKLSQSTLTSEERAGEDDYAGTTADSEPAGSRSTPPGKPRGRKR